MPDVVSFTAPHEVALVAVRGPAARCPGSVRVRTWYSGISAGTELTAYRGSNPYLTGTWDAERRLFVAGRADLRLPGRGLGLLRGRRGRRGRPTTWTAPRVGDVVHGIWGHRSEAVVPAAAVRDRRLDRGRRDLGHLRPGRLDRAQRRARRRGPARRPGRGLRPGRDRAAGHPAGHPRRRRRGRRRHRRPAGSRPPARWARSRWWRPTSRAAPAPVIRDVGAAAASTRPSS